MLNRISSHTQSTSIYIGGVYVPNSLDPSLTIWYDASDGATLSPNANNGTQISQWADKSAVAKNQTPVGGSTKPVVSASIQNGKTMLGYDGLVDATDANVGTALQSLPGMTLFVVFKLAATGSNEQVVQGAVKTGGNYSSAAGYNLAVSSSNQYTLNIASGSAVSTTSDTKIHLHTIVFDGTQTGDANRLKHRVDGIQQSLTFSTAVGTTTSATINTLIIGYNTSKANYFGGLIGEVVFYNKTLNTAQITGTEAYLKSKWGIS